MRKYLLLAGASFCCLSGAAWAAVNCATPPSCKELGYTQKVSECSKKVVLHCPFDLTNDNAVFCGGCVSGYVLVNATCKKAYSSCSEAGYLSSKGSTSGCTYTSVSVYNTSGEKMTCYDESCTSTSSSGSGSGSGDKNCTELDEECFRRCQSENWGQDCYSECQTTVQCLNLDKMQTIFVAGGKTEQTPSVSLRCIDQDTCRAKYLQNLASVNEDDFEVYA